MVISTHSLDLIDSLVFEVQNEEELNQMSVYRLLLVEGCLRSSRTAGSEITFARADNRGGFAVTESVVLCEGYHDRAFWAGLLLSLNCTDPRIVPGGKRRMTKDIRGETVTAGQFYYYTQTGNGLTRLCPVKVKTIYSRHLTAS